MEALLQATGIENLVLFVCIRPRYKASDGGKLVDTGSRWSGLYHALPTKQEKHPDSKRTRNAFRPIRILCTSVTGKVSHLADSSATPQRCSMWGVLSCPAVVTKKNERGRRSFKVTRRNGRHRQTKLVRRSRTPQMDHRPGPRTPCQCLDLAWPACPATRH